MIRLLSSVCLAAGLGVSRAGEPRCCDVEPVGLASKAPARGEIATIRQEGGVWTLTLDNGVVAHHKQMDGRIELALTLSGGILASDGLTPAALRGAVRAMERPATGAMDRGAMEGLLEREKVDIHAWVGGDSVTIRLSAEPERAELLFELAHALLVDGEVDAGDYERWRTDELEDMHRDRVRASHALRRAVGAELARDGARAFGAVERRELEELGLQRVREVLRSLGETCSVEVGIAGDLQRAPALELASAYLGAVPARARVSLAASGGETGPVDARVEIEGLDEGAALVGVLGPAGLEMERVRALRLAADVLEQRLKERIPDGEVVGRYEPRATGGGLGVLYGAAIGSSVDAEGIIREELGRLAAQGPSEEELKRAKKERYERGGEVLDRSRYWAGVLSERTRLGLGVDDIERAGRGYLWIRCDEVKKAVAGLMSEERRVEVSVRPR